ncbi:MAG: hypothetical protein ABIB71_03565 [Candidatus Woesearchaeota archaeon]
MSLEQKLNAEFFRKVEEQTRYIGRWQIFANRLKVRTYSIIERTYMHFL